MKLNQIYSVQEYRDSLIVEEKRENKDYKIYVAMIPDDDEMIAVLVDGHHSLEASMIDGVDPEIEVIEYREYKSLEDYVIAAGSIGGLSNPVNIVSGDELW